MPSRKAALLAWGAALAGLLAVDWALDRRHDGSTLSECTRHAFRVDHPAGRAAFTAAWGAFTVWFWLHVANKHRKK